MTVKELIDALLALPPSHLIVTDQYSEYTANVGVQVVSLFDNGGYYSRVYNEEGRLKAHDVVLIGPLASVDT